mgnify:CR=1 FL=1
MIYVIGKILLSPILLLLLRPRVRGKRHLWRRGSAILVSNHWALTDPILIALICPRIIHYMAKKELFDIKGLGPLITALGAFPVDRSKADINAIKLSLKAVRDGRKLLIFPEGTTRHKEGDEAKEGAARIALKTGAPILPIYISENKKFRSNVYVVIGEPFTPEPTRTKEGSRALADEIMRRIYALKETY